MSGVWHGELAGLGGTLRDEAQAKPPRWAWRSLSRGAVVACRVHPQYQALQFRIAREHRPADAQRAKWQQELAVFEHHLQLAGWTKSEHNTVEGGIEALYLSPEPSLFWTSAAHESTGKAETP